MEEYLRFWLENYGETKLRLTTLANYRAIIGKHIVPVIGTVKLENLSWQHLQALYKKKQEEGLSARTVRLIHAIMHRALGWASDEKRRILFENVAEAAEPPALVPKEVEPLTEEEAVRLLAAAYEDRYYAAFVLAATLGMHRGEILALTWDNVDLENGILYVTQSLVLVNGKIHFQPPKTKKSKGRLEFSEEVSAVLKRHRVKQLKEKMLAGEGYQDNNLVFATEIGTLVNPRHFIRRHFKPALRRAGLPLTVRFHDLRHTCASLMLASGEALPTVADLLRHARRSTTADMYAHSFSPERRRANKRLATRLLERDGQPKKKKRTPKEKRPGVKLTRQLPGPQPQGSARIPRRIPKNPRANPGRTANPLGNLVDLGGFEPPAS
ncbi:MAG: site-specific integrase [Bacillota bacterium]